MDIKKLKQKVISEVNSNPEMTDRRIFNFVLKQVNNDLELAIQFMLTEGGYTKGQVKFITDKKRAKTYLRLI